MQAFESSVISTHRRATVIALAIALAIALLAGLPAFARAQPGGEPKPSEANIEAAKRHFNRARAHHDRGEWDRAAQEYLAAYALNPHPFFVFNTAQVYRLAGDAARAVSYYEQYLALEPDGPGANTARKYIAELGDAARAQTDAVTTAGDARTAPAPGPGAPGPTAVDPANTGAAGPGPDAISPEQAALPTRPTLYTERRGDSGIGGRKIGLIMMVAGGMTAAAGVVTTMLAKGVENELESLEQWSPESASRYQEGQTFQLESYVFYGLGAAVFTAGVVVLSLSGRGEPRPGAAPRAITVAPAISPAGAGLTFRGQF